MEKLEKVHYSYNDKLNSITIYAQKEKFSQEICSTFNVLNDSEPIEEYYENDHFIIERTSNFFETAAKSAIKYLEKQKKKTEKHQNDSDKSVRSNAIQYIEIFRMEILQLKKALEQKPQTIEEKEEPSEPKNQESGDLELCLPDLEEDSEDDLNEPDSEPTEEASIQKETPDEQLIIDDPEEEDDNMLHFVHPKTGLSGFVDFKTGEGEYFMMGHDESGILTPVSQKLYFPQGGFLRRVMFHFMEAGYEYISMSPDKIFKKVKAIENLSDVHFFLDEYNGTLFKGFIDKVVSLIIEAEKKENYKKVQALTALLSELNNRNFK